MGFTDIGWKESLDAYFERAMALLFPKAHAQIDWSRPVEFLDKELQQIAPDGATGTRVVDKLAKVFLNNGREQWILLHVEVQGTAQGNFGHRMYVYHYRIEDHYNERVASFAVLADDSPDWRPSGFADNLLGCSIDFRFPTAKLLDFVGKEAELEANPNPFAVVILAFLNGRATADDDKRRSVSKIRLIRGLYERGLGRDDVRKLFRLINWFMVLPRAMENEVWHEIEKIEQEKQMQHLTTIEQIWLEEGEARGRAEGEARGRAEGEVRGRAEGRAKLEAAIELALRLKFGPASATTLMPQVHALTSAQLDDLMPLIETTPSADELLQRLPAQH